MRRVTETVSERNIAYLDMMRDIYGVSAAHSTKTYICGGFTIDIFESRFLREHGNLDGFTENLTELFPSLSASYQGLGYAVKYNKELQMLEIRKDGAFASFNPLNIDGKTARWRHIGDGGSVFFPAEWLDTEPRGFYDAEVYTSGFRFEYAVKTKAALLGPEREPRDKDLIAVKYLKNMLRRMSVTPGDVYKWIWSYNPYWYKKGYEEYFRPAVASSLFAK